MQDVVYKVDGMTCGGCVGAVTRALERAGVRAKVSLEAGTAAVPQGTDEATVRRAVEDAGFDFGGRILAA